MIDYIKICNLETQEDILSNELLKERWIDKYRSDVLLSRIAIYNSIRFIRRKFRYTNLYFNSLEGSLHYFKNHGIHNYNDFKFSEIVEVINDLCSKFDIEPTSRINNIEFGVNIVLPFECNLILENIVSHRGERFTFEKEADKNYYQCKRPQFIIKIYDKSLQNGLPQNVLRFEIKVLKMQYLQRKGINVKTLNCLKNKAIYKPLGMLLYQVFDEMIVDCENINADLITATEREKYYKAINPNTWSNTNRKTPAKQKELQRLKSYFDNLIKKYVEHTTNKEIALNQIKSKWSQLSEIYQVENTASFNFVHNLLFRYRVTFGHKPFIHYHRPSIYTRDF